MAVVHWLFSGESMLFLFLSLLYSTPPTVEVMNFIKNEDIIQPRHHFFEDDSLYILDEGCECVWTYQKGKLSRNDFAWGQGPEELSRPIQLFSFYDDKIWVIHQNGMKVSLFDTDMSLLENITSRHPGNTIYLNPDARISVDQESSILSLFQEDKMIESISILPDEDMGYPARYVSKLGDDTVLVLTSGSLANKVGYGVYDLKKGQVIDHGVYENLLHTRIEDLPKQVQDQLFFATTVGSVSFHPNDGFLVRESAVNKEASFLYLRRYSHAHKSWTLFKIPLAKLPGYPHLVQNLGNNEYILVGQEFVATIRIN